MMPTPTYVPLATLTLATGDSSVTLSSIPADYRDLILVINHTCETTFFRSYINGDGGSNYNYVVMNSSLQSNAYANVNTPNIGRAASVKGQTVIQFMDYSSTDKHKTLLSRTDTWSYAAEATAFRWANTNAITSVEIRTIASRLFDPGTTFALYGVN